MRLERVLPTPTTAPPRRQPIRGYRIRWYAPWWKLDPDDSRRWSHRWYSQEAPALSRARRLLDKGMVVEMDVYGLDHQHSVRWDLDDDVPF